MGKPWMLLCALLLLFCGKLCNGLPINLETSDSHTQLLTGLVAVLLTVCSIVFVAGCLCCQRRNGFKEFRDSPVVASTASNLDHGHVNPISNGEFTIFTPLSPPHQNNNIFLANQQQITRTKDDFIFGDVDVSSWFDGNEKDFPRTKLKYIKEIGKGWFGRVVEGTAQGIHNDGDWTSVVVRILEATASSKERVMFLHDASIYRCGEHPNLLRLLGRSLETIPLLILQEYCLQGDLKKYLLDNKSTSEQLLATEYPLVWCCQLTSALKHLHDHKITHPDLAARNCQLASNLTLKLGDYGLAVFQYPDDYYQGAPGVPVRWCAPESLNYTSTTIQPKKMTFEANVWALGVTIWEIFECGQQPYTELTDDEVIAQVLGPKSLKLSRPKCHLLYTDYIFGLMQMCWTDSESRPTPSRIELMLTDLLQVYKNTPAMCEFDKRWETFKPNTIVKTDNAEMEDELILPIKPLSPSLNNLHGSLDNLSLVNQSWLENVATTTGDMSFIRGLSDAIKDLDNALDLESVDSSSPVERNLPQKLDFKLGPFDRKSSDVSDNQNDSLQENFVHRNSSGSDTEEENWKKKIERGAYTEKVRQKSRSVADLMVLTHIDQSESENETPLPSLDYRTNYKNVRYLPKQNLENVSLMFGSEGNLLSVEDTFKDELKKLQEEHKDSLLFVPENSDTNLPGSHSESSPSRKLMQELNGTNEMRPPDQVFNVFNVTIDQFSPLHLHMSRMNDFINYEDSPEKLFQSNKTNLTDSAKAIELRSHEFMYDSGVEGDRLECDEVEKETKSESQMNESSTTPVFNVPRLVDLIQDNDALMDYIIEKYENECADKSSNFDSLEASLNEDDQDAKLKIISNDNSESKIDFDLSDNQTEAMPNSLTHSIIFTSSTHARKSLPEFPTADPDGDFTSLNFFAPDASTSEGNSNLYSLETWDNFLGKALDDQGPRTNEIFDNFSSEPQSLLYLNDEDESDNANSTFVCDEDAKNLTFTLKDEDLGEDSSGWESNGNGWFLHPQSNPETVSGTMTIMPEAKSDSYVGFEVDDEIMAAIRNELLNKLPKAQNASNNLLMDEEENDPIEKNEVFLRYNVYNTPLSPIPEESILDEESSNETTPRRRSSFDVDYENTQDSLEEQCEQEFVNHDTEDPTQGQHEHLNRHTPSQDSCCSNDTLFNLEELIIHESTDADKSILPKISLDDSCGNEKTDRYYYRDVTPEQEHFIGKQCFAEMRNSIEMFLKRERVCEVAQTNEIDNSDSTEHSLSFLQSAQVAPLPSPEENPWKQLPASFLNYSKVKMLPDTQTESHDDKDTHYVNENESKESERMPDAQTDDVVYDDDIYNEADYVNIVNLENSKNSADFHNNQDDCSTLEFSDGYEQDTLIINNGNDRDIFGVLTDIRFNGPADSQLMTTSFSESNELNDEQDWDSGSDTRSSSSGEFIWKEGEHEESLKALRAAPQDEMENAKPMENILEETSSDSSGSDEECESPEFVPSAWDKYATPTKSALRSPEKTLERREKKSKGVWFKKQKYHCVYEYPREPESPVLHSYDLWQPTQEFSPFPGGTVMDDEFFISSSSKPFDAVDGLSSQFFPGNWINCKHSDNITPDSGVEDITPAKENDFLSHIRSVQSLSHLASEVVNRSKKTEEIRSSDVLGGLRHTRDKLKLDLPPSPNSFTSTKVFGLDLNMEPVAARAKPSFTTFGKSRFSVQHVDTPPEDEMNNFSKNVSFEALPYKKPLETQVIIRDSIQDEAKGKIEVVRGEASLLDSADEDSGIESSTLERKVITGCIN